jgi:hypothetical protein
MAGLHTEIMAFLFVFIPVPSTVAVATEYVAWSDTVAVSA